jgi:hypothetical protein
MVGYQSMFHVHWLVSNEAAVCEMYPVCEVGKESVSVPQHGLVPE